jgi:hypothetical protein
MNINNLPEQIGPLMAQLMHINTAQGLNSGHNPYASPYAPGMQGPGYAPMSSGNIPSYQGIFNVGYIEAAGPLGNHFIQQASQYVNDKLIPSITGVPGSLSSPLFGRHNTADVLYNREQFNKYGMLQGIAANQDTLNRRKGMSDLLGALVPDDENAQERVKNFVNGVDNVLGFTPFGASVKDWLTPGGMSAPLAEGIFRSRQITRDSSGRKLDSQQMTNFFKQLESSIAPGVDFEAGKAGDYNKGLAFTSGLTRREIGANIYELSKRGLSFTTRTSEVEDFDSSKYKGVLEQYNKVTRSLTDLFGGKEISELIENLDKLTAGGSMKTDPVKLKRMVDNITNISRITGVTQSEIMQQMASTAQIGAQLGIGGAAGAQIGQVAISLGSNMFQAGRQGALTSSQREYTELMQNRLLAGATSEASKQIGAILNYAKQGQGGLSKEIYTAAETYADTSKSMEDRQAAFETLLSGASKGMSQIAAREGEDAAFRLRSDPRAQTTANELGAPEDIVGAQFKQVENASIAALMSKKGLSQDKAMDLVARFGSVSMKAGETYEEALRREFAGSGIGMHEVEDSGRIIGAIAKDYAYSKSGIVEDFSRASQALKGRKQDKQLELEYARLKDVLSEEIGAGNNLGVSAVLARIKTEQEKAEADGLPQADVIGIGMGVLQGAIRGPELYKKLNEVGMGEGQEDYRGIGRDIQKAFYQGATESIKDVDAEIKKIEKEHKGDEEALKKKLEPWEKSKKDLIAKRDEAQKRFNEMGDDVDLSDAEAFKNISGTHYAYKDMFKSSWGSQRTIEALAESNKTENLIKTSNDFLKQIADVVVKVGSIFGIKLAADQTGEI